MRVPGKNIGKFAQDLYLECSVSRESRKERGARFKNIFLTGDAGGNNPAIFNNTYAFIDNLASYLYSPVELRFSIDAYGQSPKLDRAKNKAASAQFHKHLRRSEADTTFEQAVTWGLVKGKAFLKLHWTEWGLYVELVQPEAMGVYQENLGSLDEQEAFCHTSYITPDRLWQKLAANPDRNNLYKHALKASVTPVAGGALENDTNLRQMILGGFQPLGVNQQGENPNRGQVDWLQAPVPQFATEVMASLVPFHELWVWDDERGTHGEWTTIQFIDQHVVLTGELTHRNIFADQYDPLNTRKKTDPSDFNPLAGHQPFIEVCPNPLDGYFWGRSEIANVALLQEAINDRIRGIGRMLRRQEDPPKFFSGVAGLAKNAFSMMKKNGGYLTDSNPNAKATDLYPTLPEGLWDSLHEYEKMFDKMAGFTPTMSGRGESGVRSQAQAESLVRTASPRFKDRALLVERQAEAMGSQVLDMLKAHVADPITVWVDRKDAGVEGTLPPGNPLALPPVEGQVPVKFTFYDLGENCRVSVDSHSSSPAFSAENEEKLFRLHKAGAVDAESLLEHTHPPGADAMVEKYQQSAHERQQQIAELTRTDPQAAEKILAGRHGR